MQKWQQAFSFVLIDEFQDINAAQYEVIRLLVREHGNLFAVGDDDQSIYGFRGANPGIMQKFLADFPNAKKGILNQNYRSGKDIITASMKVISENENRIQKEITAGTEKEGSVVIKAFPDKEAEYENIRKALKESRENGELKKIALIFRTNQGVTEMKNRLRKDGIPFYGETKEITYVSHFVTKDIEDYIRFALGEDSRERFLHICNKPSRYISRESLGEGSVNLEKIEQYYENNREKKMAVRKLKSDLFQLKTLSPFLAVTFIRKAIGYDKYLTEYGGKQGIDKKQTLLEAAEWVQKDAASYRSMEKWLLSLEERRQEESNRKTSKDFEKEEAEMEDRVTVLTMHAAKGLEYETVFLPGINEGTVPYGKFLSKEEEEEERRIFYVAMTRAKNRLEISFAENEKEKPSHFLSGL